LTLLIGDYSVVPVRKASFVERLLETSESIRPDAM
jgi:hypothetical protein